MSSAATQSYRWSRDGFLRAYEAGAFDGRVELIDGEVVPVNIGMWHGRTTARLIALLATAGGGEVDTSTLPSADSLPDPDCWVARTGAQPVRMLGSRIAVWAPQDVLLVVEVSDDSLVADLNAKAALYGSAGYPTYWVVSQDVIYEHTQPTSAGYRTRVEYRRGERIPVGYADTHLSVDEILGTSSDG